MNAEDASHANSVEPAVVDQPPDRLRVHAELGRDLADAHQAPGLSVYRRHNPSEGLQVSRVHAWADRLTSRVDGTYRSSATACASSRTDIEPSNFALIRPSRPTRNVHGSDGRCHWRTQRFSPLRGSFPS